MKDKVIIFFTRIPTLGRTKTRLEPFLSKSLCVDIQMAFIKDIYFSIREMGVDIIINYSEHGDLRDLRDIAGDEVFYLKQEGRDLGEKMYNAISFALNSYKKVILIGSDLPLITREDLDLAFEILEKKDIVISPTLDGGYYLIGMKEEAESIFKMEYSTSSVFEETIEKISRENKTYGIGNIQLDIDDRSDFLKLYDILSSDSSINCKNTRRLVEEIMEKCDENE